MDQKDLAEIFNDSYERVLNAPGKSGEFFSAFYALFIANSPEAASKFRNTDMEKLFRMLKKSVAILCIYGSAQEFDSAPISCGFLKGYEFHLRGGQALGLQQQIV